MPLSKELTITLSQAAVRQPFFSSFLYSRMRFDEHAPMCATDGVTIYLDDWWRKLPPPQRLFVLIHEVTHEALQHPEQTKGYIAKGHGPYNMPLDLNLLNIAEDLVINSILVADKIGERPKEALYDPTVTPDASVPDVYKQLVEDADFRNRNQQQQGGQPQQSPSNGPKTPGETPEADGKGKPMPQPMGKQAGHDAHLSPPSKAGTGGDQEISERIGHSDALQAAVEAAKEAGEVPGHLARALPDIDLDAGEGRVDWIAELRDYLETSHGRQYQTTARLNRRRMVLPPHLPFPSMAGHHMDCCVVAIDASGSIPEETLRVFRSETAQILEHVNPQTLLLIWWDTEAHCVEIEDVYDLATAEPIGGGGTRYHCVPRAIKERGLWPDVVICLTDGMARVPDEDQVPWPHVTVSTYKAWPWGKTIPLQIN